MDVVASRALTERRNLWVVPGAEPPPAPPTWSPPLPAGECLAPEFPTIAVLQCRDDAPVGRFVLNLLAAFHERGEAAALLWSERVDTLPDGVFTVAEPAALFPEALRAAAEFAPKARIAHVGAGAELEAAKALLHDLVGVSKIVMDGRMLGVMRAHRSVVVEGEGPGQWRPEAEALRARVEVELVDPGPVAATAVLRALDRVT